MITAKVKSVRGFLQRNLCKCPSHVKNSYTIHVRPILDYACSVWSPYHQHNISKIEMVQRRAAHFVTNNYDWNVSVTDMLQHLQWEPLQDRRNNVHAITMYKIANNLIDISPTEGSMQLSNSVTRGHPLRFTQLQMNVDSYKYSFYLHTITLWNNLPNAVVTSLETFKTKPNIQLP